MMTRVSPAQVPQVFGFNWLIGGFAVQYPVLFVKGDPYLPIRFVLIAVVVVAGIAGVVAVAGIAAVFVIVMLSYPVYAARQAYSAP